MKPLSVFISEVFDYDEEIASQYRRVFDDNGFDEGDDELMDIQMWRSLGPFTRERIIEESRFTGAICQNDEYTERLVIMPERDLLDTVSDAIDNYIESGEVSEDLHYTLCYKSEPRIWCYGYLEDFENNPHIRYGKRVNWKNRIERKDLLYITDDVFDSIYTTGREGIKSFLKENPDFEYYKNGRQIR